MATRFKRATTEDLQYIKPQEEALEQDKIRRQKVDFPKVVSEDNSELISKAKNVLFFIDNDRTVGYEPKNRLYFYLLPLFTVISVWAQIKTMGWAFLTFVRHVELEYEPKSKQTPKLPWYSRWTWKKKVLRDGTRVVVKWFNLRAAMRVWWCVPQKKRGETLKPKYASLFFDALSKKGRACRNGAASWKALVELYHHKFGSLGGFEGKMNDVWMSLNNSRGVRNRHRLITKKLKEVVLGLNKPEVRLLSVACGSAEAVIQTVRELRDVYGVTVDVTLLDLDEEALAYARCTAERYGISTHFSTVKENIRNLEKVTDGPYDVIEMLGFLDYQVFPKAVSLVARLRNHLSKEGVFLTCNVNNNFERHFVRWVISWPMIYRSSLDIAKIMVAGGFQPEKIELIQEPARVHTIAICNR